MEGEREMMMRRRETAAKWKSKSTTGHRQRERDSKSYNGNRKWRRQSGKRRGKEEGDWGRPGRQPRQTEWSQFPSPGLHQTLPLHTLSHTHTQSQTLTSPSSSPAQTAHTGGNFKSDSTWMLHTWVHKHNSHHPLKGFQQFLTDSLLTNDLLSCSCLLTKTGGGGEAASQFNARQKTFELLGYCYC